MKYFIIIFNLILLSLNTQITLAILNPLQEYHVTLFNPGEECIPILYDYSDTLRENEENNNVPTLLDVRYYSPKLTYQDIKRPSVTNNNLFTYTSKYTFLFDKEVTATLDSVFNIDSLYSRIQEQDGVINSINSEFLIYKQELVVDKETEAKAYLFTLFITLIILVSFIITLISHMPNIIIEILGLLVVGLIIVCIVKIPTILSYTDSMHILLSSILK